LKNKQLKSFSREIGWIFIFDNKIIFKNINKNKYFIYNYSKNTYFFWKCR